MFGWNTTEGGPCFLRPTADRAFDGPNSEKMAYNKCLVKIKKNGKCKIDKSSRWCANAKCTKDLVMTGQKTLGRKSEISGPWSEDAADFQDRHNQGWNNQFALPYEVGLYWNFTVGGVGQRAIGCPGLDEPFGTVDEPNWPHRNTKMPIFGSPAMQCDVNTYAPDGKPMHEIVDELASDNELWAEKFLEGWQQMTSNGYASNELVDGPQSGWVGHYSLTKQGIAISDFEAYIADNAPVTFTDPEVRKSVGVLLSPIYYFIYRRTHSSAGIWDMLVATHFRVVYDSQPVSRDTRSKDIARAMGKMDPMEKAFTMTHKTIN